jgi:outer membrane protein assembly factor BamA
VQADIDGTFYPSLWDVREPFGGIDATASTYVPLPLRKKSVLALRAGGAKRFGDFPFYEAAFIGGASTIRSFHHHQYAGDASVYGSAELRFPLGRVAFVLPFDLGLIGFADAGRVFVKGESPGGWHAVTGLGTWIGLLSPATSISISVTNRAERRLVFGAGVSF